MSHIHDLSLAELAIKVEKKQLSPVEIVDHFLERIDTYDKQVNAFISIYADEARAQAKEAEREIARGHYRGPLHGIPIGLKDNLYMRDRVTTMGSRIHADFVPTENAHVVDLLDAAGAIIVGKLNLHEYALGVSTENPHFGTSRNPWDLERTSGGSSGGSAVAVAGGLIPAALGTDTSGSIRIPASVCGLVGLKPTFGRISKRGCFPEAWSLDHVGPMTSTVLDAAILLDALSGYDPLDPASVNRPSTESVKELSRDMRGVVVGVEEDFYFGRIDTDVERVVRRSIDSLKDLGAEIRPITIPSLRAGEFALTIIDSAEFTTVHDENLRTRPNDFGEDVRKLLGTGALPTAVDYLQSQQLRARICDELATVFEDIDVIAGPTVPIRAPRIGERTSIVNGVEWDNFEALVKLMGPANLGGLPAVSVPCGVLDGLPVGLQILGAPLAEQNVLNVAAALESTKPLNGVRPRGLD